MTVFADATRTPEEILAAVEAALSRDQVVDRILARNPGVGRAYLARFGDEDLRAYLEHLEIVDAPRRSAWIRRGDSPAIMTREPEE